MKINNTPFQTSLISFLSFLALMLSVSGNLSAGEFVPYKSKGVAGLFAEPVPGQVVSGVDTGNATHLGKYRSTLDLLVLPLFEGPLFVGLKFVGPTTIFAANGDLVKSILDVDLEVATNTITGIYTVTGGTGRWDGASGGGLLVGAVNADGTFSYKTKGVISRPKSRK
ncbi:MAG: hypothetical protein ACJAVK_001202 [Akkermansiaceae bacterium]|jgi:hypothetical protein